MATVPLPKARPPTRYVAPSMAPSVETAATVGAAPLPPARPGYGPQAPSMMGGPPLPKARPPMDIDGIISRTDGGPEDQNTFLAAAKAIAAYKETGDPLSAAAMGFITAKAAKEEMRQAAEDKAFERAEKRDERDYQREQDERTWDYRSSRDAKEDEQWGKSYGLQVRQDEREESDQNRRHRSQDYDDLAKAQAMERIAQQMENAGVDPETRRDISQALKDEITAITSAVQEGIMDPEEGEKRTAEAFSRAGQSIAERAPEGTEGDEDGMIDLREPGELTGELEAEPPPERPNGLYNDQFMFPPTNGPMATGRLPMAGPGAGPAGAPPAGLGGLPPAGGLPPPPPISNGMPAPAGAAPGAAPGAPATPPAGPALSGEGTQENPLRGLPEDEAAASEFVAQMQPGTVYEWRGYLIRKK